MLRSVLAALPIVTVPLVAVADQPADSQGRFDHMMWGGGYGMIGGLMMVVFWGLIIALIVLAVKWLTNDRGGGSRGKADAMDTLRERFASGEIDEEEFERRKKVLKR